jgi:alpha-ketoglutarate-dependent taurine dioxygenase
MGTNPQVLWEPVRDRRAWTARTIDPPASWYYPLPASCLPVLDRAVAALGRDGRPVTAGRLPDELAAAWSDDLAPVAEALESGRGFAIVEGIPPGRYSPDEMQAAYWLVGQALGRPSEQNVQGTLLYDVRDYGQDVARGARFSVTSAESSFHTDNSFGPAVVDYVGLLCLNPARAGGQSQVVSGYAAHNELLHETPELLEVLYEPFHIDRRGGTRPGEPPTIQLPVLRRDGTGLTFRYLRYWIEAGHQKAGQPLTPVQLRALDALDDVLRRPDLRVEFHLGPGQMFFINNRWILHNRTAFEDHPDPARRRHLVRLWLRSEASAAS